MAFGFWLEKKMFPPVTLIRKALSSSRERTIIFLSHFVNSNGHVILRHVQALPADDLVGNNGRALPNLRKVANRRLHLHALGKERRVVNLDSCKSPTSQTLF